MSTTINNTANEKGSISDSNGVSVLPVHTYARNTAPQPRVVASLSPVGLFSFAATTFIMSVYNAQADGLTVPNLVIAVACFSGSFAQIAAGSWEFLSGNLFGGSALIAYGNFWFTYAAFVYPGLGLSAAFADHPGQLNSAIGIFLAAWFIITFIFLLATLRFNLILVLVFLLLDSALFFLMIGEFSGNLTVYKMGGGIGVATAIAAFYAGAAQVLTEDVSRFTLPVGSIPCRLAPAGRL